jgi:hypothetical protein
MDTSIPLHHLPGIDAVGLSSIAESETGVATERSAFLGVLLSWSSKLIRGAWLDREVWKGLASGMTEITLSRR